MTAPGGCQSRSGTTLTSEPARHPETHTVMYGVPRSPYVSTLYWMKECTTIRVPENTMTLLIPLSEDPCPARPARRDASGSAVGGPLA